MIVHGFFAKVAGNVVTGVVGVAAYDALRRVAAKAPVHEAAVTATEWGLRGRSRPQIAGACTARRS
jgi:hypothetical protein